MRIFPTSSRPRRRAARRLPHARRPAVRHGDAGPHAPASGPMRSRPCARCSRPRCQNCHPAGDRAAAGRQPAHTRTCSAGPTGTGWRVPTCTTCHGPANPPTATARTRRRARQGLAHAAAGQKLVFVGVAPRALCEQLKDPARNGGKDMAALGTPETTARDLGLGPGLRPRAGRGAARRVRRGVGAGRTPAPRAPWTARGPHRASVSLAHALRTRPSRRGLPPQARGGGGSMSPRSRTSRRTDAPAEGASVLLEVLDCGDIEPPPPSCLRHVAGAQGNRPESVSERTRGAMRSAGRPRGTGRRRPPSA